MPGAAPRHGSSTSGRSSAAELTPAGTPRAPARSDDPRKGLHSPRLAARGTRNGLRPATLRGR